MPFIHGVPFIWGATPGVPIITLYGIFGAAGQNWWATADGGVIDYTAILPKLWPTALGTDEGVRPPTGKAGIKNAVWVTPGPKIEVAPTCLRRAGLGLGGGGWIG